jgi:rRNA-processing protein FCF1
MFDSDVFDYIYENNLFGMVKYFVDNKIINMFVTPVQLAEINAISEPKRKEEITKMVYDFSVEIIPPSLAIIGIEPSNSIHQRPGFQCLKIEDVIISDLDRTQELELSNLQGSKEGRNKIGKYSADIMILFTAMKRGMDYVITADRNWVNRLRQIKRIMKSNSRLSVIDISKNNLIEFLNKL